MGSLKNLWTWGCRTFAANAVRLQLHALAYNLGNFMRTLAMPKTAEPWWSLTSLREKLIKIGAKVISHSRYVTFQFAEIADRSAAGAPCLSWLLIQPDAIKFYCGAPRWDGKLPSKGPEIWRMSGNICGANA
jgi:hypothetical protein